MSPMENIAWPCSTVVVDEAINGWAVPTGKKLWWINFCWVINLDQGFDSLGFILVA